MTVPSASNAQSAASIPSSNAANRSAPAPGTDTASLVAPVNALIQAPPMLRPFNWNVTQSTPLFRELNKWVEARADAS
ncbi:hypothetical protein GCM10010222_10200 [Streptomyces tanashiensis]|nr:hypothetical protein GCM10010222_10200 [Streptomyces tanashiensis]